MSSTINLKSVKPKQAISIAILVVVIAVVVWLFFEKISTGISRFVARIKQESQDLANYGTPTPTTDFESLADQIYRAMRGWGTDEEAVERVLSQIKSNADWAALRAAYKKVQKAVYDKELDSRIAYEGTKKELERWRKILDENGVTIYQF